MSSCLLGAYVVAVRNEAAIFITLKAIGRVGARRLASPARSFKEIRQTGDAPAAAEKKDSCSDIPCGLNGT